MTTFPVETYLFGLVNAWYCFAPILPNIFHCLYYIPLVHDLKLGSIYEVSFSDYNKLITLSYLPPRVHSRGVDICLSWLLNFQGSP